MEGVASRFTIAGVVAALLSGAAQLGASSAVDARVAALPPAITSSTTARPHPQPNIIVILADDLGYADISTYRGGRFPTPHIDALARSGVLFTEGYASAPVCAP